MYVCEAFLFLLKKGFWLISDGEWYAYVNFYSAIAAQRALKAFGQSLIIQGQRCHIVHKKRDLKIKDRLLYINQCEDLANYYLGFNHWQSQILYHQKESENHQGDKLTYATAVKLVFDGQEGESISVEGVGLSQIEYSGPEEKMHKLAMGQKSSKNAAVVNAFAKTVLVLVYNPNQPVKATIKIDHQVTDPFYYNAIWSEDKPIVENVNELDQEPDLEK